MRLGALGFFVMAVGTAPASAQSVPILDVEATCRAAPRLLAGDADPYAGCIRDERDAEREVKAMWSSAAVSQREMCAQEAQIGGSPSYVDMLTCLQMAQGTGSGQPGRRPAPQ